MPIPAIVKEISTPQHESTLLIDDSCIPFPLPVESEEVIVNATYSGDSDEKFKLNSDVTMLHHDYLETHTIQMKDASVQTDLTILDMNQREEELTKCREQMKEKDELGRILFVEKITEDDASVKRYLGIPSVEALFGLFAIIDRLSPVLKYWRGNFGTHHSTNYQNDSGKKKTGPTRKLTRFHEFLLTLLRLRLALPTFVLADLFGISKSRVSQIFVTWINYLNFVFSPMLKWPTSRSLKKFIPKSFKYTYPKTTCIVDCTEFFIEKPSSPTAQMQTYSSYKHRNTFKALVSITPSGAFSFVSNLWGGNVSDRFITQNCGILDLIKPGNEVMADRGFVIRDLLLERHASLNIPPFTKKCSWGKGKRLAPVDITRTRKIAKLRIHVERAIGRLKNFKILENTIPLKLKPLCNQILKVCALLCNFQKPLVQ